MKNYVTPKIAIFDRNFADPNFKHWISWLSFSNCFSASLSHRVQYIVRVLVCAAPFTLAASPLLHRYSFCVLNVDCDFRAYSLYLKECIMLVLVIIVYATKFPERWFSGTFDCFGQSHNLFHVLICVAADLKFEFIKAEFFNRGSIVKASVKDYTPYSFSMLMVAILSNVTVCFVVDKVSKRNYHDKVKCHWHHVVLIWPRTEIDHSNLNKYLNSLVLSTAE